MQTLFKWAKAEVVAGDAILQANEGIPFWIDPGVSPGTVLYALGLAVLGAVINGRQYYRDTRGYCYYVDRNGQPIYDYNARC